MNARTDTASFADPNLRFATMPSGVRLPYVATGAGEPIVFVHGSLCDYRYWDSQIATLSRHFLCISVSLSHYWPAADAVALGQFGWRTHVDELADFIGALGLGPVHLLGHSRGGCVAFQLAQEHPHLTKTLMLADPGGPLQLDDKPVAALPAAVAQLRSHVASLIEAGQVETGLEIFVDSVSMPGYWKKSTPGFRTMATDNAATLPKQFRDAMPAYTKALAARVQCKTLLIEGEKSPRMYRQNVTQLAQWLARADKHTIAHASHGMNVANPGAFNRLVQGFVEAA